MLYERPRRMRRREVSLAHGQESPPASWDWLRPPPDQPLRRRHRGGDRTAIAVPQVSPEIGSGWRARGRVPGIFQIGAYAASPVLALNATCTVGDTEATGLPEPLAFRFNAKLGIAGGEVAGVVAFRAAQHQVLSALGGADIYPLHGFQVYKAASDGSLRLLRKSLLRVHEPFRMPGEVARQA